LYLSAKQQAKERNEENESNEENKNSLTSLHSFFSFNTLPTQIDFGSDRKITYLYDAAGNKISKQVKIGTAMQDGTYSYLGSAVYDQNNALAFLLTEEGRIIPKAGAWQYEYFLKDHLGDTRVTFTEAGPGVPQVLQETHYYPFGMAMNGLSYSAANEIGDKNKLLYNRKELGDEFGLGLYDFSARNFDPITGRTTTIDPHGENYFSESSYSFLGNNPMNIIDPSGMDDGWYTDGDIWNFDPNVHSQQYMLDNHIDGTYQFEQGWATQKDGDLFYGSANGSYQYQLPAATVSAYSLRLAYSSNVEGFNNLDVAWQNTLSQTFYGMATGGVDAEITGGTSLVADWFVNSSLNTGYDVAANYAVGSSSQTIDYANIAVNFIPIANMINPAVANMVVSPALKSTIDWTTKDGLVTTGGLFGGRKSYSQTLAEFASRSAGGLMATKFADVRPYYNPAFGATFDIGNRIMVFESNFYMQQTIKACQKLY
jgi:RHS repeat-associated protein